MHKPFYSIDNQYKKLKLRGMQFSDLENAKKHLLLNNYYNVVNGYSKFFYDEGVFYKDGTLFEEILSVQLFDKELKSILFKYIMECENHFKSLVSYFYSEHYQNQKYSYLHIENYNNNDIHDVVSLTSCLSKIIKFKNNETNSNSIKHYVKKHHDVPIWVLINYMTLGQTLYFYKLMTQSDQNRISKEISKLICDSLKTKSIILQPKHIITFISNVIEVRNLIAHNNQILNYKCKRNNPYIKELHSVYGINPKDSRQDIFNVFITMQCFLSENQFEQLHNDISEIVNKLRDELNTISCNKVLSSLGLLKY